MFKAQCTGRAGLYMWPWVRAWVGRKSARNTNVHAGPGGEGGIRTLDTGLSPYNALAGRHLRPLGHLSALICRTDIARSAVTQCHPWPQVAQAPANVILCV